MGQSIGTIKTQKLSENEFSYEWHFCKVNFDLVYWSPIFGFTCKEFSRCYLEMKPDIISRVLTFFLRGCEGRTGSKITSNAVLIDGNNLSFKSIDYDVCLDLNPSMKIFEIHLNDTMLSGCFNYIFKLEIKLHSYLSYMSSILNENALPQSTQNNGASFISFNNRPISIEYLEYDEQYSTTFNEDPTSTKCHQNDRTFSTILPKNQTCTQYLDASSTTFNVEQEDTRTKNLESNRAFPTTFNDGLIEMEHPENNRASSATFREESGAANIRYTKELVEDLSGLYTSGSMCDMKIRIGEDIFHAHKLILCTRSPVFKRMVESLEPSSNCITITDGSVTSFKKFLKYLYTGEIEDGTMDTIMSLYLLGKKYNVSVLPKACSSILQNKLSSECVDDVANIICDVLQFSESHRDSKLRDLAACFIINHFPVVSKKQSWKDLIKSNFELISNILALVAK